MNDSRADLKLEQTLDGAEIATIEDVITRQKAIDAVLPTGDGLKWFNLLYLQVTQQVDSSPSLIAWANPLWLTRLDVVFARLYFDAVKNWLHKSANVASSWQALLEARFTTGIDRIQFALAGMNAHINHDLAIALLQTDGEMNLIPLKNSPEHDDFERVNGIPRNGAPGGLAVSRKRTSRRGSAGYW